MVCWPTFNCSCLPTHHLVCLHSELWLNFVCLLLIPSNSEALKLDSISPNSLRAHSFPMSCGSPLHGHAQQTSATLLAPQMSHLDSDEDFMQWPLGGINENHG